MTFTWLIHDLYITLTWRHVAHRNGFPRAPGDLPPAPPLGLLAAPCRAETAPEATANHCPSRNPFTGWGRCLWLGEWLVDNALKWVNYGWLWLGEVWLINVFTSNWWSMAGWTSGWGVFTPLFSPSPERALRQVWSALGAIWWVCHHQSSSLVIHSLFVGRNLELKMAFQPWRNITKPTVCKRIVD